MYGSNYNTDISNDNIEYKGSFKPEELPKILNKGFGLIWDGKTIDTCTGEYGNYLRYNNPHKLSLYLASGLPVFIWNEAAEAEFVEKNGLGFSISDLRDIDLIISSISMKQYEKLCANVKKISDKLVRGEYTKNALVKAVDYLENRQI